MSEVSHLESAEQRDETAAQLRGGDRGIAMVGKVILIHSDVLI